MVEEEVEEKISGGFSIVEDDFIMEYEGIGDRFTLSLEHIKHAKDPTKAVKEMKIYGYAMSTESCLKVIINERINKKHKKLSFQEYIKIYGNTFDELKKHKNTIKDLKETFRT